MAKTKSYKTDFLYVTRSDRVATQAVHQLLLLAEDSGGFGPAARLEFGSDDEYQIRSVSQSRNGNFFYGVFGRCRYGEKPVQGASDGREEDVTLKPGHGLVEKNHFIFSVARNMFIYQRNASGSRAVRFSRYLTEATNDTILLEPILTRDSYLKLLDPLSHAKRIEFSFTRPKDAELFEEQSIRDAVELMSHTGALQAKIVLSVGREKKSIFAETKNAVVKLARSGLARVARVKIHEDDEPIDLIADRVVDSITVNVRDGKMSSEEVYAALEDARTRRENDLVAFFGD